jgi:hypothetical protein
MAWLKNIEDEKRLFHVKQAPRKMPKTDDKLERIRRSHGKRRGTDTIRYGVDETSERFSPFEALSSDDGF